MVAALASLDDATAIRRARSLEDEAFALVPAELISAELDGQEEQTAGPRREALRRAARAAGHRRALDLLREADGVYWALVWKWARLVRKIAKRLVPETQLEDAVQEGLRGAWRAALRFEVDRGFQFSTYATAWISQAIGRARDQDGPVYVAFGVQSEARRLARLEAENPRATVAELGELLGVSEVRVHRLREARAALACGSLDAPVGDEPGLVLLDLVADEDADVEERASTQQARAVVARALAALPERKARILRERHGLEDGEERTLDVVGAGIGVTRERVRQLEAQALVEARRALTPSSRPPAKVGGRLESACARSGERPSRPRKPVVPGAPPVEPEECSQGPGCATPAPAEAAIEPVDVPASPPEPLPSPAPVIAPAKPCPAASPPRKVKEGPYTLHCRSARPDGAGRSTYELIRLSPRRVEVLGLLTHEEALGVLRDRAREAEEAQRVAEHDLWSDPIDRVFFNLEAGPARPRRRHLPVMDALALLASTPIPSPSSAPPQRDPPPRGVSVHDAPAPPPPGRADRAAALRRRAAALDALEGLPAVDQLLVRPDGVDDGTWAAVREAVATALHRRGEQLEAEALGGLP